MSTDEANIHVEGCEVRRQYFEELTEACEVAREGCAVFDLPWRSHLVASGPHARRFVHNMTTCQIKELAPGSGRFGMSVDSGGKIVADFFVEAEEDRLVLESTRSGVEALSAHLKSHIIADRVTLSAETLGVVLALTGAGSTQVLERALSAGALPEEAFAWADVTIGGLAARARNNPHRLGVQGWDVTVDLNDLEAVRRTLLTVGASRVGHDAFEVCRVLAGVPRVPVDMGSANVPLEADSLAATIDWDKGCYIGQEVIAMMHYRGRPNRHLRALALSGDSPSPGTPVTTDEGREVGAVGTVVRLPEGEGRVGLAVIKRKHADPGTRLQVGGRPAQVLALPLA